MSSKETAIKHAIPPKTPTADLNSIRNDSRAAAGAQPMLLYESVEAEISTLRCVLSIVEEFSDTGAHSESAHAELVMRRSLDTLQNLQGEVQKLEQFNIRRKAPAGAEAEPALSATWHRGTGLAFAMLEEIEATSLDLTSYGTGGRAGQPQRNILLRYMDIVEASGDSRLKTAFAAIVTDYMASWVHAGSPSLSMTKKRYRNPIASTGMVS